MRQERDLYSQAVEAAASTQIAVGHVGWPSGEHFDRGDPSGPPGHRHTLVYVTLGGINAAEMKTPSGRQIICCINSMSGKRVPPVGTRVWVAIPAGMEESPGASCIIAAAEDDENDNLEHGEVVHKAAGGAAKVVLRNDGALTLYTTSDNSPAGKVVVFTLSSDALKFASPWGSFTFDASGFHLKTAAGPRIDMGGVSIPGLPSALTGPLTGYVTVSSPVVKLKGGVVYLGEGTVYDPVVHLPINPALPPPSPQPGPSTPNFLQSTNVWIASTAAP